MDIICASCQSKFRIADDKVPAGKKAAIPCPKCKQPMGLEPNPSPLAPEPAAATSSQDEYDGFGYDSPFDFAEEEGKTALICESNPDMLQKIIHVLKLMEYHITEAEDARDALKRMRYHNYDLVVVNERFDAVSAEANGVLIYLERLHMSVRRNMFVILIGQSFRTMDQMVAFQRSVNLVINEKNIDKIDAILGRGIAENDIFYRVHAETLRKLGRI